MRRASFLVFAVASCATQPVHPTSMPVPDEEVFATCTKPNPACDALCTVRKAPQACEVLSQMYSGDNVWGGHLDAPKSLDFAVRACTLGLATQCEHAAYLVRQGKGAPKDPAREFKLFERGCDLGEKNDCREAGAMLFTGSLKATDPNANRASKYLEKGEAWRSLDAIYQTWLLRDCSSKLPHGKDACLKDAALNIAVVDKFPEMDEEARLARRNSILRASCAGVPRPECAQVPEEEAPLPPLESGQR